MRRISSVAAGSIAAAARARRAAGCSSSGSDDVEPAETFETVAPSDARDTDPTSDHGATRRHAPRRRPTSRHRRLRRRPGADHRRHAGDHGCRRAARRAGGRTLRRSARSLDPSTWRFDPTTLGCSSIEQVGHGDRRRRRVDDGGPRRLRSHHDRRRRAGPARPRLPPDRSTWPTSTSPTPTATRWSPSTPSTRRSAMFDPASYREVLTVDQPYPNHNGGQLAVRPRRPAVHRPRRRRRGWRP